MTETHYDAEIAAVLIALAPLGERALQYVNVERCVFEVSKILEYGWSTSERALITLAAALFNPVHADKFDITDLVMYVDGPFFAAGMNAIAARRRENVHTDFVHALDLATGDQP